MSAAVQPVDPPPNPSPTIPPVPANPGVDLWPLHWRLRRRLEDLEVAMLREISKLTAAVDRNAERIRAVDLRSRKSGHDLEEWKEDSKVREVRELQAALHKAIAEKQALERAEQVFGRRRADAWLRFTLDVGKVVVAALLGAAIGHGVR